MYNEQIKNMLDNYSLQDIDLFKGAIREITQIIILSGLSRAKAFSQIAFYGGTCLRIFHNLERFSEDLDFSSIVDNFNEEALDYSCEIAKQELAAYGIAAEVTKKDTLFNANVLRRYFKIPTKPLVDDYLNGSLACHHEDKVTIKLEVDLDNATTQGATFETKLFTRPDFASIKTFDISSLFAGKLGAVLNRNWKTRVKGRDFYDYLFYISNGISPNLTYLSNACKETFTIESLKAALRQKFDEIDFDQAKADVSGFVRSTKFMGAWSKELFIQTLDLLK